MSDLTQLALAQLTAHTADQLVIQLLRPADTPAAERTLNPAAVRVLWPTQPTIIGALDFPRRQHWW